MAFPWPGVCSACGWRETPLPLRLHQGFRSRLPVLSTRGRCAQMPRRPLQGPWQEPAGALGRGEVPCFYQKRPVRTGGPSRAIRLLSFGEGIEGGRRGVSSQKRRGVPSSLGTLSDIGCLDLGSACAGHATTGTSVSHVPTAWSPGSARRRARACLCGRVSLTHGRFSLYKTGTEVPPGSP